MALTISLFARQVGAAAAQGAADAAAIAVTDLVPPDWDCSETQLDDLDAKGVASRAAVDRTAQLAAVQPTTVEVRADGTCSVIVSVRVESAAGWGQATRSAWPVAARPPPRALHCEPQWHRHVERCRVEESGAWMRASGCWAWRPCWCSASGWWITRATLPEPSVSVRSASVDAAQYAANTLASPPHGATAAELDGHVTDIAERVVRASGHCRLRHCRSALRRLRSGASSVE